MSEPLHAVVAALGLTLGIRAGRSKSWPEALRREQLLLLACCAGSLLYVAYLIYIGGNFMSGRMFTAVLLVALIVGGLVLTVEGPALTPATVSMVTVLAVASLFVSNTTQAAIRVVDSGVVNERAYYPWLWLAQRRGPAEPPPGPARPDRLGASLRAYGDTFGPITVRSRMRQSREMAKST